MTIDVENALPFFADLTGKPLQGGQIYFGVSGQNPVTNQITVYWDAAGTQPVAQPVAIANGLTTRNGTPARVYVSSAYSRLVLDSTGRQVSYDQTLAAPLRSDLIAAGGSTLMTFMQAGVGAVARPAQDKMRDTISVKEFGVVGDGVTDDTVNLQKALDAIQASAIKTLDFCGLNILVTKTVYAPSQAKLRGNGATLRCPVVGFLNDGVSIDLPAMLANKAMRYSAGEATDENIEISGFNFISGSNRLMDTIQLANTKNAVVRDNIFTYQQATFSVHHVDCHHSNVGTLICHNKLYHESTTVVNGACIAVRNSNSLVPTDSVVVRDNYMYKNGTNNPDEFMWVNGATGVVRNTKIVNNSFVASDVNKTPSVLTIYPFTNGGTITTSEVYNTIVQGNTFSNGDLTQFSVIVGYLAETKPAHGVVIDGNTFLMKTGDMAVKLFKNSDGLVVSNNLAYVQSGSKAIFFQADSSVVSTESAQVYGNTLAGAYSTAFYGGYVKDNYCQTCDIFASDCRMVSGNVVDNDKYQFVYQDVGHDVVISNNDVSMNNYDASLGVESWFAYIAASAIADVLRNIVRYKGDGFKILRGSNAAAAMAKIRFTGNTLYKEGAADTPTFQTFGFPFGNTDANWLFDRNSNNTPAAGYGAVLISPAFGHLNIYSDTVAGAGVVIGTIKTTSAVLNITATLS